MVTANVCMCGSDGTFDSMGEGMIVNFDGTIIAHGTSGRADEIITAEVRPDLVREARAGWGVENNIYQLGHRGYVGRRRAARATAPTPTCTTSSPAATACRGRTRSRSPTARPAASPKPTRRYRRDVSARRPNEERRAHRTRCRRDRRGATSTPIPIPGPINGDLRPENTALIVIDMQTDFCGEGGYVDKMGYDLSLTRAPIEPIRRCSRRCAPRATTSSTRARATGPTSPTCRPTSAGARSASAPASAIPGPCGRILVRGEPGWDIIPELCPIAGRADHRQARQGLVLRHRPRADPATSAASSNIVLTGITTDVCVHTTMREANDRGFECLLLEDCCGATDHGNHLAAIKMVKMQGGVFGAVSNSTTFVEQLP